MLLKLTSYNSIVQRILRCTSLRARASIALPLVLALLFQGLLAPIHAFQHIGQARGATISYTGSWAPWAKIAGLHGTNRDAPQQPQGDFDSDCPLCVALHAASTFVPCSAQTVVSMEIRGTAFTEIRRTHFLTRHRFVLAQPRAPPQYI